MIPEVRRSKRLTAGATKDCDEFIVISNELIVRTMDVLESEVVLEYLDEASAKVSSSWVNGLAISPMSVKSTRNARLSLTIELGLSTTMKPCTRS